MKLNLRLKKEGKMIIESHEKEDRREFSQFMLKVLHISTYGV